jgi:YHS domain-containing protein
MRTILVICLALIIALSFGCSKKKEEAPKTETATQAAKPGMVSPTYDVVSKEEVDVATSPYSYEYNGVLYFFTSAENMEAFKADPAKYIPPVDTTTTPPPQGQ